MPLCCLCCLCSDAGNALEVHAQDFCQGSVVGHGSYLDDAFLGQTAYALCETEVSSSCPPGWVFYLDDGSEGTDSCVLISATTASTWAAANASCPIGSHLLTVRSASSAVGLLPFATSLYHGAGQLVYVGCFQDAAALSRAGSWSWVDGTDASNLNCGDGSGGNGCGLWNASQPRCHCCFMHDIFAALCCICYLLQ